MNKDKPHIWKTDVAASVDLYNAWFMKFAPLAFRLERVKTTRSVNKRRKEESDKMGHLIARFGRDVPFVLFLCGYFDAGYLGYEAAEGIDWVWEHRIDDFAELGL